MDVLALKNELKKLRASLLWAYANGHGCTIGDHPVYRAIRQRDADLCAMISEHEE